MKQIHFNILLALGVLVCLWLSLPSNEKEDPQTQPINYELFEHRFNELQKQFDTLASQSMKQDTVIQAMKFQIVTDEKVIRSADNSDIDSIFNAMVSRQRKSIVQ